MLQIICREDIAEQEDYAVFEKCNSLLTWKKMNEGRLIILLLARSVNKQLRSESELAHFEVSQILDNKDDGDDAIMWSECKRAPIDKGWEEKLHSKINTRRGKLRLLTAKSNEIELLMENVYNLNDIGNKQFKVYKRL